MPPLPTRSSDLSSFRPQMKIAEVENAQAGILSQKPSPSSLENNRDGTAASEATLMANVTACIYVPNDGRVRKRWPRERQNHLPGGVCVCVRWRSRWPLATENY